MDLEMLIARLRWPIAATRWWAMQELAALLLCSEGNGEVATRLLAELSRCRLEAEAVEVLCVFWIAIKQGYGPLPDLAAYLHRTSLLAVMLLHEMKLKACGQPSPPLQTASDDFEVPAGFLDIQGLSIPRIYLTRLEQLERDFGLPFVSQCAFEWSRNEAAYPEAPLQGDLGYFVRSLGNSATGGFASRAMLRMLSAYQRTLDVARVFWGVPDRIICSLALEALPVDPTLAFLRPVRPPWLPELGKKATVDASSVEAFIGSTLNALTVTQPGSALLALASPIYVGSDEIVEISVVRWRQWGTAAVDARALAGRFYSHQERWGFGVCRSPELGLATMVPTADLKRALDHETKAAPMAAVYGFNRIGYLQKDLYPSRLYYPMVTGFDEELVVEPLGGELKISAPSGHVATAYYWTAGWSPVHPQTMSGLCGTALVGTMERLQAEGEPLPDRNFYLWQITRLKRTSGYEAFTPDEPVCGVVLA